MLFRIKWIVRLSDTTVDALLRWSSIQQTITYFYQETRLVWSKNTFSYLVLMWFSSHYPHLVFLLRGKRKDKLEYGISAKYMRRLSTGTYTHVLLTTWGQFAQTFTLCISYHNGWPAKLPMFFADLALQTMVQSTLLLLTGLSLVLTWRLGCHLLWWT